MTCAKKRWRRRSFEAIAARVGNYRGEMAQIDGARQQDTDNQNAEALQAALAQREVTPQGQPQGGSDVPSHQNSDPAVRRIGNSTVPSGSYRKTSCTVMSALNASPSTSSPSRRSIARLVLPSRLELNRPEGSLSEAPLAKVSFTMLLYVSPVQISPS